MKALFGVKLQRIVVTSHFRFVVNRVVPLIFRNSPTIVGEEGLAGGIGSRSGGRHVHVIVIPQMAPDVTYIRNRSGDLIGESMLQGYVVGIVVTMRISSGPNEIFAAARCPVK